MTTNEKVNKIRALFSRDGINAYIIPNSDPHVSEYIPDYYRFRTFVSGFTGSAGTLVVSDKKSGLWTDGRYFTQAEGQLSGSEIELYRMLEKGVPTISEFFAEELPMNGVLGMDGDLMSVKAVNAILDACKDKNVTVKGNLDYANEIWCDGTRPEKPCTEVYEYDIKYAGESCEDKIKRLREQCGGKAILVTRLDSVAWLFNIRANDIALNPVALAYGLITPDKAYFFTDVSRVNDGAKKHLSQNGVELLGYNQAVEVLGSIDTSMELYYDEAYTNYNLYLSIAKNSFIKAIHKRDLVTDMKAVKNEVEIKNIEHAQIKDGCAMVEAFMKMEKMLEDGETVTEWDVSNFLLESRAKQELNKGASFTSIVGYRSNAAMMHYAPTENSHAVLEKSDMLLIDSGGQYLDGTCDITRTMALGPVPKNQMEEYTVVLKAMISLARAKFLKGATGAHLDVLARHVVWERGLDYRCGTGHGVGCFLNVHEGPQNMRKDLNDVVVTEGMILTDEPGIYTPGSHGIRTENMLVAYLDESNEYGDFLRFKTIGCYPIDTKIVVKEMLSQTEIDWLNNYHQFVYDSLSPRLNKEQQQWLQTKCAKI